MLPQLLNQPRHLAVLLLFAGAMGLLAAVLVTVRALAGHELSSPGRRAFAHFLPVAVMALLAVALGHPQIGIGIAFATSVAALSTVVGFVLMVGDVPELSPRWQRVWLFLPVPVLLSFLVGFKGNLSPLDAGLLLAQGGMMLLVWIDRADPGEQAPPPESGVERPMRVLGLLVALLLAGVGGWAAIRGVERLEQADSRFASNVMGGTLLSVVLALPMVSTGAPQAAAGRAWSALTAQVGLVFLNLGLLVPLCVFAAGLNRWSAPPATHPVWRDVLFPRIAWRVDLVALMILSLLFVAAATGKVRLDKRLCGWLIMGYCVYLAAIMWMTARGG